MSPCFGGATPKQKSRRLRISCVSFAKQDKTPKGVSKAKRRVHFLMDADLLEEVDAFCEEFGKTRTESLEAAALLLLWAVASRRKGRRFATVDEEGNAYAAVLVGIDDEIPLGAVQERL